MVLQTCIERVFSTYTLIDLVKARTEAQYTKGSKDDQKLRKLWELLKPAKELDGLVGKHWQEVGFQ